MSFGESLRAEAGDANRPLVVLLASGETLHVDYWLLQGQDYLLVYEDKEKEVPSGVLFFGHIAGIFYVTDGKTPIF